MTEPGQEQNDRVATMNDIVWLESVLTDFLNKQAQMLYDALYASLAPTLLKIDGTLSNVMPVDALQQHISKAISAGMPLQQMIPPYPETVIVEIVEQMKLLNERLERIEKGQAFLAGALNQLGIAQARDTREITSGLSEITLLIGSNQQAQNNQQAGNNQQIERLIDALQRAVNQGLNATPHATPLDRSTGSSRVLHVTVATPDNATPDATPPRRSTGVSKVLQKKAATPDGKRALIKEFYTQWPDASLNDCEQALGIERSTVSRIRKALKETVGL